MSNHVTATQTQFILLYYPDGVKTLVPTFDYATAVVKEAILDAIKYFIEDYEEDSPCGIVWHIDSILNGRFSLAQGLFNGEIKNHVDYVGIPFHYDLGENETEEEIQKVFPEYKYQKNILADV